jgi:hypothetical protein
MSSFSKWSYLLFVGVQLHINNMAGKKDWGTITL